jgi:enoyl-CoA hydratase/carnithine racemase
VPNHFQIENLGECYDVRLVSEDGTNRLTRASIRGLSEAVLALGRKPKPIIFSGNVKFFSAGADLREIQSLTAPSALEFAKMGRGLMSAIALFPAPGGAAIRGYCMGGGLDLALACHWRIASPDAVFGHRGAALGLVTGWGGTQRLPRLLGKGPALKLLTSAGKLDANDAARMGLVNAIADDPTKAARVVISGKASATRTSR